MTRFANRARQLAPISGAAERILITAVSPFEDLPGFQYYSLLCDDPRYSVSIGDDSEAALTILGATGANIYRLAHPGIDRERFLSEVLSIANKEAIRLIVPGADAHLFALAQAAQRSSWVRDRCPPAAWLAERRIENKYQLQEWIRPYLPIPKYLSTSVRELQSDSMRFAEYPFMVKGLHKGAIKCEASNELVPAARVLLQNPANKNADQRVYLEECIDGEEHCLVLLCAGSEAPLTIGLRKLATTQTGTTLAAAVEYNSIEEEAVRRIGDDLLPGMAIELEWRGAKPSATVFEVNVRFPSWIGALGTTGRDLLTTSLDLQLGRSRRSIRQLPSAGSLIYRLPQSGYLSPDVVFNAPRTTPPLLWPSASPHQFLVK